MNSIFKALFLAIALFFVGVVIMFFSKGHKSKKKVASKGVENGQLAACFNKPNCVSSFDKRDEFFISPSEGKTLEKVESVLHDLNFDIVEKKENYIHATETSKIFGFVDDIEILFKEGNLHYRSSSRVGYSDLGANRKRIQKIKNLIEK